MVRARRKRLTSVDLSAKDDFGVPNAGLDNGAVLLVVADFHILTALDVVSGCVPPGVWQETQRFELVAYGKEVKEPLAKENITEMIKPRALTPVSHQLLRSHSCP